MNGKQILFGKNQKIYKANLHCHTTLSDGRATPEEIKDEYKKHGYSVVAFTDHERVIDNSYLSDEEFLAITSAELAIKENASASTLVSTGMRAVHLNFYAKQPHNSLTPCYASVYDRYPKVSEDRCKCEGEYPRALSKDGVNDMIRRANEAGFLVSYNHPSWSLEDARNFTEYEGLFAVEIYNHGTAVTGHLGDENVYDVIRKSGKRVYLTACDDNHNKHGFEGPYSDSFGGWVCIDSPSLKYSDIISALENGDFYASTGPEIYSIVREGENVTVECSDCRSVFLVGNTRRILSVHAENGNMLRRVEFTLHSDNDYFRIRITDKEGKNAWSQAYDVGGDR